MSVCVVHALASLLKISLRAESVDCLARASGKRFVAGL